MNIVASTILIFFSVFSISTQAADRNCGRDSHKLTSKTSAKSKNNAAVRDALRTIMDVLNSDILKDPLSRDVAFVKRFDNSDYMTKLWYDIFNRKDLSEDQLSFLEWGQGHMVSYGYGWPSQWRDPVVRSYTVFEDWISFHRGRKSELDRDRALLRKRQTLANAIDQKFENGEPLSATELKWIEETASYVEKQVSRQYGTSDRIEKAATKLRAAR